MPEVRALCRSATRDRAPATSSIRTCVELEFEEFVPVSALRYKVIEKRQQPNLFRIKHVQAILCEHERMNIKHDSTHKNSERRIDQEE